MKEGEIEWGDSFALGSVPKKSFDIFAVVTNWGDSDY